MMTSYLIMVGNPASLSEQRTGPSSPGTVSLLAQIVETDGRIGGAAEKQSQCLLSAHNDILRPNRKIDGRTQFRLMLSHHPSVLRSGYIAGYTEDFAMSDT